MSQAPDYIPQNNELLNLFQANLNTRVAALVAGGIITATSAAELDGWCAGFVPLYDAISNEETRSSSQVSAFKVYRKNFVAFLRQFCQGFLTNNPRIAIEERVAMKLNPRGLRPRTSRVKISTAPIPSIRPLTGGEVYFGFKVEGSNKVSARHPQSNGVEVFYKIVSLGSSVPIPPPTPPTPPTAGGSPTPSDDDANAKEGLPSSHGFTSIFNSRARFVRQLDLDNIGKVLHVYARWVNTSNAQLNSTFSMVATVVIS